MATYTVPESTTPDPRLLPTFRNETTSSGPLPSKNIGARVSHLNRVVVTLSIIPVYNINEQMQMNGKTCSREGVDIVEVCCRDRTSTSAILKRKCMDEGRATHCWKSASQFEASLAGNCRTCIPKTRVVSEVHPKSPYQTRSQLGQTILSIHRRKDKIN